VNIVNSTVTASPIAQASPIATQTITYTGQQRQDLEEALRQIRELLDQNELDEDDAASVRADVDTIDALLALPRPSWAAVQAVLSTLVAGLTVVTQAQPAVDIIRHLLPS
jgi:negative regulator of replication initiation